MEKIFESFQDYYTSINEGKDKQGLYFKGKFQTNNYKEAYKILFGDAKSVDFKDFDYKGYHIINGKGDKHTYDSNPTSFIDGLLGLGNINESMSEDNVMESKSLAVESDEFIKEAKKIDPKIERKTFADAPIGSKITGGVIKKYGYGENTWEKVGDDQWKDERGSIKSDGHVYVRFSGTKYTINESSISEATNEKGVNYVYVEDGEDTWYFQQIDSTHVEMVNDPKYFGVGGMSVHHVREFRGRSWYEEITKWAKVGDDGTRYKHLKF